ncbi:MAG: hypothetical protein E7658_08445 [Ruminococcaceae bacterium]|nr:hypothetical protein [Oscillospiraceae bacterium]
MFKDLLKEINLPDLLPKEQMLEILQTEIYGKLPAKPDKVEFSVQENVVPRFCAGKAAYHLVTITCHMGEKTFSFPVHATLPMDGKKHPFFVHINFRPDNPDRYQPTEEIIDNGFAVLSVYYEDVTKDDNDFTNGLAGVLFENGERPEDGTGKIAMWAWAAHRVLDYAETLPDVLDMDCAVVCGHSRLGKTALLAGATDTRFAVSYSNDSGCAGAAIARWTTGEPVSYIYDRFPFWFCQNYSKYRNNESAMPCDQHYLAASIAPRKVLIGSASKDGWACPVSEQFCCFAASPAFPNGFVCPDRLAEVGEMFFDGDIGYHLREGQHYFGREDWNKLILFVKKHFPEV